MHRISGRRNEIESRVEIPGGFVFCVNDKGTNAGNVCHLQHAQHGTFQKSLADPPPAAPAA